FYDPNVPPNRQTKSQTWTWKMYGPPTKNCDTDFLNSYVFTKGYVPDNKTPPPPKNQVNVTRVPLDIFQQDLTQGTLPFYSFIMCWWDDSGFDTSMHPNHPVEYGENLLACIYNALRNSQYWDKTLLIVNFDENGGIYDHMPVPGGPNGNSVDNVKVYPPVSPPPVLTCKADGKEYSFDCSVLGLRVPVLLISPWLSAGVCSNQYQNTSILRFLQDLLPNADTKKPFYLTQRDLHAPSIAPIFDFSQFGRSTTRPDKECPNNIAIYSNGPDWSNFMSKKTEDLAATPTHDRIDITKSYVEGLPGHADSGKPITQNFATVGELLTYAQERRDAALAYFKPKENR
ncbi:MAG: alkaline phosphatase family protein, partial [Blastocatellia bacterium]